MAIRFQRQRSTTHDARTRREAIDGFSEWWAAIAVIAIAVLGVLALGGRHSGGAAGPPATHDRTDAIVASLQTASRSIQEIERSFGRLCRDPVLVALELEPDCASGVLTLGDDYFTANGGTQLRNATHEDVAAAITAYLARLRKMPGIWESLEAIEIRGHSDPRALRMAYQTNLIGSQQRAVSVLLFLIGPDGLSAEDRADLERVATVSGASFSRPPVECPDMDRICFPKWRRVEFRPVLSESTRREDWSRTIEDVRVIARRGRDEPQPPLR
jgi:flagellar motor protein MotB